MDLHEEKTKKKDSVRASAADRTLGGAQSINDKAKSDIAGAAEAAKTEARRIANQQKNAGADRLGEVAGAVARAAGSLETGMPQMASYAQDAAARLEGAANTLRQRNIDDLVADIGNFARTQPVLFLGGAMLAGFALTRFLPRFLQGAGPGAGTTTGVSPSGGNGGTAPGRGLSEAAGRR
jgi:uncharacterized phage infection (PIP) family protein YhgE